MFNTAMKDKMFKAAVAQRYGSYIGRLIITHNDRERIRKERAQQAKHAEGRFPNGPGPLQHPVKKRVNPRVPG